MTSLIKIVIAAISFCISQTIFAADNVVNVFTWSEEIPHSVITAFEKETGITVHYSTFDSNEMMYAKLRAAKNANYDLIEPSSYYIDRMRKQGQLAKLDKTRLSNFKNLDPFFLNKPYDPQSDYSIPFIWGITGVFLNKEYFPSNGLATWDDLLDKKYENQLMFLDDAREVFGMALLMLGYSINDHDPNHIKEAYNRLKSLMPNVKLFNSDAIISILIDEDATVGMVWNGDLFKARLENPKLQFVYPKNGFEIWVDNFAILQNAQHKDNAYRFLDYLMRPDVAKTVSMKINYSSANLAARNLMPNEIKNSQALYPSYAVLHHGQFQTDVGDNTFLLFEKYWERLKIGG